MAESPPPPPPIQYLNPVFKATEIRLLEIMTGLLINLHEYITGTRATELFHLRLKFQGHTRTEL